MIAVTTETVMGKRIVRVLGMAEGSTVRAPQPGPRHSCRNQEPVRGRDCRVFGASVGGQGRGDGSDDGAGGRHGSQRSCKREAGNVCDNVGSYGTIRLRHGGGVGGRIASERQDNSGGDAVLRLSRRNEEERVLGQPFEVDLEAELDLSAAGASDDIADSVSYTDLYRVVKRHMEGAGEEPCGGSGRIYCQRDSGFLSR